MMHKINTLKYILVSTALLVAGCQTAEKPSRPLPRPKVKLQGQASKKIPASTISNPRKWPPKASLPVSKPQKIKASSGQLRTHFPIHDTGGSLAFTKEVDIPRLGVDPIDDDTIRVWARVRNVLNKPVRVNIICSVNPRTLGDDDSHRSYNNILLPENTFCDVSFTLNGSINQRFTLTVLGL